MNNKIIVSIIVPILDIEFDVATSNSIKVGTLKKNAIKYISASYPMLQGDSLRLLDRNTGDEFDNNFVIRNTTIKNGNVLVLI